jgi:hypothetical protein
MAQNIPYLCIRSTIDFRGIALSSMLKLIIGLDSISSRHSGYQLSVTFWPNERPDFSGHHLIPNVSEEIPPPILTATSRSSRYLFRVSDMALFRSS